MPTFDPTINLGHVLTFFGFMVSVALGILAMRSKVDSLVTRMMNVETELKKMNDVLVEVARQDERVTAMDRRIDDLQHGRGFVLDGLPRSLRSGP